MKSAQILCEKIRSEQLTLGILTTNHFWMELIEIARNAGLDYLIIDQEHGVFDEERVVDACSLGRLIDFPILIRPHQAEFNLLRRTADKGPCGFLLPAVESAATLDDIRDALYMPPRGKRRPGGVGNRWVSNVQYTTWRDEVENDFIVLPQIETLKGLGNVEEIAQHEITTAIAIGPYDLSAALGVCWDGDHPKLRNAIHTIREAGRAAGKNMWVMGDGVAMAQQGFSFICIGEPTGILEATLKERVAAARSPAR